MLKPRISIAPPIAALLLGACCLPLAALGRSGGRARGNEPGPSWELAATHGNALRPVETEQEFQAVLRADRAALFFWCDWSVNPRIARPVVEAWVREDQPPFGVFLVHPDKQPYVRQWLEQQGRDSTFHSYEKDAWVVWLRRGIVVAEVPHNGRCDPAVLRLRTREASRNQP